MENPLYPAAPSTHLGKDFLNSVFPMLVTEYNSETNEITCSIAETTWVCKIDPHAMFIYARNFEILIARKELYALVDISNCELNWLDRAKNPNRIGGHGGRLLEFGVIMANQDFHSNERRIACIKDTTNDNKIMCLSPIVRVDRPMGRFQPDGRGEITYQLLLPNTVVVGSKPGFKFQDLVIKNGPDIDLESEKVKLLTHYGDVTRFLYWLNDSLDASKNITSLIRASHLLWMNETGKDSMDYESREQLRGSENDPREAFDTPESIHNRFMYQMYGLSTFDSKHIKSITAEVYSPQQLVKEIRRLGKKNGKYDLYWHDPSDNTWSMLQGGITKNNGEKILKQSKTWRTPYFILSQKRKNRFEFELAFINLKKIDAENEFDRNAVNGFNDLTHYKHATITELHEVKSRKAWNDMAPVGEIQFALEHEGSLYKGKKHLISYVTWQRRWFYHGWFRDKSPYSSELYELACKAVFRHFQDVMFINKTIRCKVLPEDEWRPRIPENMKNEMSFQAFPVLEIETRKTKKRRFDD